MVRRALPWVVVAVVLAMAVAVRWRYREYYYDDAWISIRYAERWITGHGLTWTDGERVEGYTDLLWVLLCGGLAYMGVPWVTATHLLGGFGFAAVVWCASVDPAAPFRPVVARAMIGGALAATTGGLAIWAVAGLEHTWLAGLASLGALGLVRATERPGGHVWATAACFAAVVLTRPDGAVLWVSALCGAASSLPRSHWRSLAPVVALPALAIGGQQLFRVVYYGDWVPNTARAKVSFTVARAVHGGKWVGDGLLHHGALVLAAAGAWGRWSPRVAVPLLMSAAWVAYVASVGGDFMAGWRMLVPGLGPLALLASEAAARWSDRVGWRAVALAAVPLVALHSVGANQGRWINKAFDMGGWVIARPIGLALRTAFGAYDPLIAVDAAGEIPYRTGFRALDMLGLTDRYLATHPPPGFGGGAIGHDLGNGEYVWSRQPDLILFNGANGSRKPQFVSGRQLVARPDFHDVYAAVNFRVSINGEAFPVHLYVRRTDGPLAIQRAEGRIDVPPWFFAVVGGASARVRDGQVVAEISPDRPGQLRQLPVGRGNWQIATDPPVSVDVGCNGATPAPAGTVVGMSRPGTVDLDLRVDEGVVRLRGATLTRTSASPTVWCP